LGGPVRSRTVACAATLFACLAAPNASAQEAQDAPTTEEMIEVARDVWRSPDRRCTDSTADEIVVCAPDEEEEFRVESPTDEAIRKGEAVRDGVLRAPDVFGLPPCEAYTFCSKVGRTPPAPTRIDLTTLPVPLTPEEAAHVRRAEDLPPEGRPTPAAASPAEAP